MSAPTDTLRNDGQPLNTAMITDGEQLAEMPVNPVELGQIEHLVQARPDLDGGALAYYELRAGVSWDALDEFIT